MEMKRMIRQGDLLFVPTQDPLPAWAENHVVKDGIIARGEATGHHHRVAVLEDAEVFDCGYSMFVKVGPNGVSIVHEEHGPVTFAPNTLYKVHRAREYDYLRDATRRVRD
jgi:hypothetical protein